MTVPIRFEFVDGHLEIYRVPREAKQAVEMVEFVDVRPGAVQSAGHNIMWAVKGLGATKAPITRRFESRQAPASLGAFKYVEVKK